MPSREHLSDLAQECMLQVSLLPQSLLPVQASQGSGQHEEPKPLAQVSGGSNDLEELEELSEWDQDASPGSDDPGDGGRPALSADQPSADPPGTNVPGESAAVTISTPGSNDPGGLVSASLDEAVWDFAQSLAMAKG